jgi:hypothetical protein
MADGFRVLENGDSRITEADVFRITERFYLGESSLSGAGSITSDPDLTTLGATSLTGTGTLASVGTRIQPALSSVTGTGTISADGDAPPPIAPHAVV